MGKNFLNTYCLFMAALVLYSFSDQTYGQTQIFGQGGYQVNTNITVDEGKLILINGFTYGTGIDIEVDSLIQAELSWSYSASQADLLQEKGGEITLTDLYIHHFQTGALIEPERNKKVSPFGLITVGASIFHPTKNNYSDEWRFSFALGLGAKLNISEKLGLRFQTRLIVPIQFSEGSIWCHSNGCEINVHAWTSFIEVDFSVGIYIII